MPIVPVQEHDDSWENLLDDLLDVESGLTPWEIDFIDSLDSQRGRALSDRQQEVLEKIHDRLC